MGKLKNCSNKLKKSQLRNIIRESIKQLMTEQANSEAECYQGCTDSHYSCTTQVAFSLSLCYSAPQHYCPPFTGGSSNCCLDWANDAYTGCDDGLTDCENDCADQFSHTSSGGGGSTGGGSCFIAGTKVKMADGTDKNIEDVKIDEQILGQNGVNTVVDYDRPKLGDRKLYSFNGGKAFVTDEHPFMTEGGWKSINPGETLKENPDLTVDILNVGDVIITNSESITIESIESHDGNAEDIVYNFILDGDHTYYANNILVHNKENVPEYGADVDPDPVSVIPNGGPGRPGRPGQQPPRGVSMRELKDIIREEIKKQR